MLLIANKKARHDYEINTTFMAGLVLSGGEVKSLRNKHGSLSGSFVKIVGDGAVLLNAQINPYQFADNRDYDPKRSRQLLLKKKQVYQIKDLLEQKSMTAVPLAIVLRGRFIKLEIGVGKGRKQFEKRAMLKKKAQARDIDRELKDSRRLR